MVSPLYLIFKESFLSVCLSVCVSAVTDIALEPAESIEMKHGVKILWDTSVPYTYSMVAFADCHNSAKKLLKRTKSLREVKGG